MDLFLFSIKDIIDILLFSIIIYYTYNILRNSGNKTIFMGIVTFVLIWFLVSRVFDMKMIGMLFNKISSIGLLVIVIIFQDDIKKFLMTLGSAKRWSFLKNIFDKDADNEQNNKWISQIILAIKNMARTKTGALIAIQDKVDLNVYEHTGEIFIADINARLIENIFFKNSPLHDGAMIIASGKIRSAACILPVSNNREINKDLGLRHRAALGLSQKTDALVIIVSEERGSISIAHHGEISTNIDIESLKNLLENNYK